MWYVQLYRMIFDAHEVTTPPVTLVTALRPCASPSVAIYAFDEDEPVGVNRQNCIARSFGCCLPVNILLTASPAGRYVRFVMQVCPDNHGVIFVMIRQHLPVGYPS